MRLLMPMLTVLLATGPALGQVVIYSYPLDTDPGWTIEGQWAFGQPTGGGGGSGGGPDPTSGNTGSNVFGYNLAGDYPNDMPATEWLTAGPFDFRGFTGVELHFYRWLGVEDSRSDHALIGVSIGGADWVAIWHNWPG